MIVGLVTLHDVFGVAPLYTFVGVQLHVTTHVIVSFVHTERVDTVI